MVASTVSGATGENFSYVTQPPTKSKGLTGNISSLFRRAAGRSERDLQSQPSNASSSYNPPLSPKQQSNIIYPNQKETIDSPASPTFLDSPSRAAAAAAAANMSPNQQGSHKNRLFYSNADDEDSQDSFETRTRSGLSDSAKQSKTSSKAAPRHSYGRYNTASPATVQNSTMGSVTDAGDTYGSSTYAGYTYTTGEYTGESSSYDPSTQKGRGQKGSGDAAKDGASTTILRYRGFSTSIKSLFLDEALVCASMGCFGLILSNRTEYLLQLRNDRRGVQWGRSSSRRTLPSRIVAYALLLTLLLIGITFVIWGFGSDSGGNPFAANNWYNSGSSSSNKSSGGGGGNAYDDALNAMDDDYAAVDDQQQQQQQNDDNAQNDDGGNQNDDGNYNYQNNDDGNGNANDDGNYNYQNNDDGNANGYYYNNGYNNGYVADDNVNYNDGYQQAAGGDDNVNNDDQNGYYNNNGYQQAAANDDAAYNNNNGGYYDYANNDYYYNGGGRRRQRYLDDRKAKAQSSHRVNGVFKLRDMKEGAWEPVVDFLSDEWYRPYEVKQQQKQHPRGIRTLEDGYYGNSDGSYSDGSSSETTHHRDLAADLRVAFIIAFLIVLGVLGRRRRMRTRYYLVRARAQEDHLFYASSGTGIKRVGFQDSREDQYEGAYPPREGDEIDDEVQVSDEGVSQRKKKQHHEDCVSRGFNCLLGLCCGFMCKCWFQCLSICALAQEAREIRLLVPTRFQRVDYITHQPFQEYQKDVTDLRKGWLGKSRKKSGIMIHFNALSRLSRYILTLSVFCLVIITCTLLFNPRASFSWPDAVILCATFGQSFLVIWIVHWIFHKSDLSLDAVVKMFAAGFVIAVPAAFFFEGLLVNITLISAYIVYGIGELIKGDAFVNWVIEHYRILWILGEVFNAYVVAAVTEELCKYYTFRCVEHPDLLFLTGLTSGAQDERALEGGVVKYPFSSHQVQRTNQRNPYDDDASQYSRGSHRSKSSKSQRLDPDELDDEMFEEEQDVRTYRQKAAAVTTAMISVAVGLACAENFLYVFLLGGTGASGSSADPDAAGGYLEEWIVLLFRSIFPVHALAAAMQSVNMVRKFVETDDHKGHRIGVGRVILPAVIMHGSFDAILLGINVFIETSWDDYLDKNGGVYDPENPPYNPLLVNGVAWFSIILVMLLGIAWYIRENRRQRQRLIVLEQQEKARESGSNPGYSGPAARSSEVELV
ncbi:MAG: hypothetical protein SGILL_000782 [Bacillariaceae sp.]